MEALTRTAREVLGGPFESEVRLRVEGEALVLDRSGVVRILSLPDQIALPLRDTEVEEVDRAGGRVALRHDNHAVRLSGSGAGTVLALLQASGSATSRSAMPRHLRTLTDGLLRGEGDLFVGAGGCAFAPRTDTATLQAVYHRDLWALLGVRVQGNRLILVSDEEASFALAEPAEALDALAMLLAEVARTEGRASADTVPFVPNLVRPVVWHIPGEQALRAWLYAGRDGLLVRAFDGTTLLAKPAEVEFAQRAPGDTQRCAAHLTIGEVQHHLLPLFRFSDLHRSLEAVLCAHVFDGVSNALGMAWRPVEVPWTSALLEQQDTGLRLEVAGCILAAQASVASQDGVLLMGLNEASPFVNGSTVSVTLARSRSRVAFRAQVAGGGRLDARTSQLGVGRVGQPYLSLRPLQPEPTPLQNRRDFLRVPLADGGTPEAELRRIRLRLRAGRSLRGQLVDASGQGVGLLVADSAAVSPSQAVTLEGLDGLIPSAPPLISGHVTHVRPARDGLVSVGVQFHALHTRDVDRIHADVLKLQVQKNRSKHASEPRASK